MRKSQKAIRTIVFLLIFIVLFFIIQKRVTYTNPQTRGWLDGIYGLEEQSVQAVFLGTSHVYNGISPQEIYKRHKLVTYNMGSSAQEISSSYYLLEELLKTQTPRVVVLDASSLLQEEEEVSMQYILNVMPMSVNKLNLAYCMMKVSENSSSDEVSDTDAGAFGKQNQFEKFFGAMVPMYNYHQRWKELSEKDFYQLDKDALYAKGYYEQISYRDSAAEVLDVNQEIMDARKVSKELFTVGMPAQTQKYLLEIKRLCEERGMNLLVTKVPVVAPSLDYDGAWTEEKYLQVKGFCKEYEIDYLDLVYDVDIGIHTQYDFFDEGHLNHNGAVKVSDYLGDYVKQTYQLEESYDETYEKHLAVYDAVQHMAEPNLTHAVDDYSQWLSDNKKELVIFVIGKNDSTRNLGKKELAMYQELGLSLIGEEIAEQSYLALIDGGQVVYEKAAPDTLTKEYQMENDVFSLKSQGTWCGKDASCILSGKEYTRKGNGLNLVIYDKPSGMVIDSCHVVADSDGHHTLVHKQDLKFFDYVNFVRKNK